MDQAKTNLPNTNIIAKSTSGLWRLHTKAPFGKLAFAYVDLLQWPHDSNLTITLLMNALLEFQKTQPIPSTLYLQMDNTARENKNKYVLGFCAALVELKIFKKVRYLKCYMTVRYFVNCRCKLTFFLLAVLTKILISSSQRLEMRSVVQELNQYQVYKIIIDHASFTLYFVQIYSNLYIAAAHPTLHHSVYLLFGILSHGSLLFLAMLAVIRSIWLLDSPWGLQQKRSCITRSSVPWHGSHQALEFSFYL